MFKINTGKVFVVIFLGLVLLTSYFIGFNYCNSIKEAKAKNLDRLSAIATTIELSLDADLLEDLLNKYPEKDDILFTEQNPAYSQISDVLRQCVNSNNLKSSLYTVHKNKTSGLFELGVTSSEEPYFRHEYYDCPEEFNEIYYSGGTLGKYKTANGEWISVIHPLRNSSKEVVSALAFDIPFVGFMNEARSSLLTNSIWSIIIYLVVGILMFKLIAKVMSEDEEQKIIENRIKLERESKRNELNSSLNYARKIQQAFWPKNDSIRKEFEDFFSINIPKDTVSGDFYWHHKIKGTSSFIVIHGDCTGHGVPGAMMSVLGNTIFNEIVVNYGIIDPAQILNLANKKLIDLLNQKNKENLDDGMAVSAALVNKETQTLNYAGANQNGIIIRNGQIINLYGDKYPVGGAHYNPERKYSSKTIVLEDHDSLYLFSDGFRDQFGGPNNKKFLVSNFYKMLLDNSRFTMDKQKKTILAIFKNWMGDFEQVDDVSLIGIRI